MDSAAQQLMAYISSTAPNYVQAKIFGGECTILILFFSIVACVLLFIWCWKRLDSEYEHDGDIAWAIVGILSAVAAIVMIPMCLAEIVDLAQWIMYPDACLLNSALKALGK